MPPINRKEILRQAEALICGDRQEDYGPPAVNFANIARLQSAYLACKPKLLPLTEADAAILLLMVKVARATHSKKHDTFIDLAGYAALAGELATMDDF